MNSANAIAQKRKAVMDEHHHKQLHLLSFNNQEPLQSL